MKNILLIISILFTSISFAQTHRFFYELTIRKPTDTTTINMVLDVSKHFVKFYDEEYIKTDSLRKATNQNLQAYSEVDQLLAREINSHINDNMFTMGYDYLLITTNDKMNWKIANESKQENHITLHKATTNFGGRTWTAWFNPDIPFQEGPYKFTGLPGLIYEIYDSANIFHYNLIENINLPQTFDTSNFLETHYGKKPINITLQQYHKIKLSYYNNIVEILNKYNNDGVSIATEKDIKSKEDILSQKKDLQKQIKSNYLPIELDTAIPYPKD